MGRKKSYLQREEIGGKHPKPGPSCRERGKDTFAIQRRQKFGGSAEDLEQEEKERGERNDTSLDLLAIVSIAANQVVEVLVEAAEGGQVQRMPAVQIGEVGIGAEEHQLFAPGNITT